MHSHENAVKKVLSFLTPAGTLKSRESNVVEFKESYNKGNTPKYAKTMAAFANNRGGYIIFGVSDKPRRIKGLTNNKFDSINQEAFTDAINSLFSPELDWECGMFEMVLPAHFSGEEMNTTKKIGWIYTREAEYKPVIAMKNNETEKISSGDVYYRYRARTQKIKHAEMAKLIEQRLAKEREGILRIMEIIRKSDSANIGIINYNNGRFSTPYGIDVAFEKKLVKQVLQKAKFIKEGSFDETKGIPVIKVTGNIDLAEEVPVPEGNPDETHPYIQKQLAETLGISTQDLYALIWYYKMKEAKKYHLEITTSRTSKTHKFSNYALQFLKEKLIELNEKPSEFVRIRQAYRKRNIQ